MTANSHARLSASSAERFMSCPGSVKLSELLPPEDESEYAAEGTAAHELGEICLSEGMDAWQFMGYSFYNHEVDADMVNAVQVYVDYVRSFEYEELEIECSLDNTGLGPDFGGTYDTGAVGTGFLHVLDYKHGIGIPVDIQYEDGTYNKQLMYYAFGKLKELGVQRGDDINVGMTIVQPRAFHKNGPIREAWVSSDLILTWGEDELIPAMDRIDTDDTPFDFGEHCRFCPAKIVCPRLIENFEEIATMSATDIPGYSNDELAEKYNMIATVKMLMKEIERECKKRALNGDPVPGTKLIYGRSTRKWKDDAEIELLSRYGEDIYTEPALKSPAEIERLPEGKSFTGRLAYKEKGAPSLVAQDKDGEPYDVKEAGAGFAGIKS